MVPFDLYRHDIIPVQRSIVVIGTFNVCYFWEKVNESVRLLPHLFSVCPPVTAQHVTQVDRMHGCTSLLIHLGWKVVGGGGGE